MKKKENWFSKHKILAIIIIAVIAVALIMPSSRRNSSAGGAVEVSPVKRDITTYNSFTGNITPVDEYDIIPKVTASVKSVNVKKGDHVTKGQILAELDSTTQQNSIDVSKAQLNAAAQSNALQVQSAQNALDNFNNGVQNGWNSTLSNAWNAYTNAQTQLQQAKDALAKAQSNKTDAVNSSNDAKTNAKNALDQANASLAQLQSTPEYITLKQDVDNKQKAYDDALNELETAKAALDNASSDQSGETDNGEAGSNDTNNPQSAYNNALAAASTAQADLDEANAKLSQLTSAAQSAVSSAQAAYNQASSAADTASDTDLTQLQQAVGNAQAACSQAQQALKTAEESAAEQQQSLQTSVDQAKAAGNNAASRLQIQQAEESLNDYTITAPVSGVVTEVNIEEGGLSSGNGGLAAGSTSGAAIVIADLDTMKVSIKVDEYSIANVKEGSPVTVYIDSLGKSYEGTITYVDDVATNTNGVAYFNADVEFTGDDNVHAGVSCEVRLTSADVKDALSLPSEAIQYHSDNTAYVMVKNGNQQEERDIEIGVSDGTYVEVKSGLDENDVVVYTPAVTYPMQEAMEGSD